MEDKSPFYTGGAEFKAPDQETEEDTTVESSKKKKKNVVSELWNKLFNKETDQPKEEQKSFLEAFGAFFRKTAEVEQDEIAEAEDPEDVDVDRGNDIRFPFLGISAESADEESADTEPTTNMLESEEQTLDFNEPSHAKPVRETIDNDEISTEQEEVVISPDASLPEAEYQAVSDEQAYEPQVAHQIQDRDLAQEHEGALADRSTNEHIDQGRSEPVIKERETIIEQRGGAGAALLGAVVANRLSKSRDRKIQAEAKELEKKVEGLQKAEEQDTYNIERLRAKSQEQADQLRAKRTTSAEQPQNRPEIPIVDEQNVIYVSKHPEAHNARPYNRPEQSVESVPEPSKRRETEHKDVAERKTTPEIDHVVLQQVEQAAEHNIALERYFERRHEVKDVPTNITGQTGVSLGLINQHQLQQTSIGSEKRIAQIEQKQREAARTQQAYKQAATQGVVAGIIMLVSLGIIVFVWSLLN